MDILYKYYSDTSDYSIPNVKNGDICFTPLDSLNDPFEGVSKIMFKTTPKEQEYWNSINLDLPNLLSNRLSDYTRESLNFQYRVFCATEDYDNPLMWAYYANSHRGFCVGYRREDLASISNHIYEIEYKDAIPEYDEPNEDVLIKIITTKSREWNHEKEHRVLYYIKEEDKNICDLYEMFENADPDRIYMTDFLTKTTYSSTKIKILKCKPCVIYLGMNMEYKKRKELINIAKQEKIKIFQMTPKESSFKIVPIEI